MLGFLFLSEFLFDNVFHLINQKDLKFDMVVMFSCFIIQENLSVAGRDFKFTLIARRSRHYAGTRCDILLLTNNRCKKSNPLFLILGRQIT